MLERQKNVQIHELISNMWLILCYTVQLVITKLCTKFQDPRSSSSWEIFDGKISLQTQTDGKSKNYIPPIYFVYRGYKYTAIFHGYKNGNFQMKKCDILLIFAQNIDRGYTLEPPHWRRGKKINVSRNRNWYRWKCE